MRNVAKTGAFGRVAMSTAENWEACVSPKRNCYISVSRNLLGIKSFKPWNNFRWSDFLLLKQLALVFNTRHLPLSNANAWLSKEAKKLIPMPAAWLPGASPG